MEKKIKYPVRKYILDTFLINFKKKPPFSKWPEDKFFKDFSFNFNRVLNDSDNKVFLVLQNGQISVHNCPFYFESEDKILGWLVANSKKKVLYSMYVTYPARGQGHGKKLATKLYDFLKSPNVIYFEYRFRPVWEFLKKVLDCNIQPSKNK